MQILDSEERRIKDAINKIQRVPESNLHNSGLNTQSPLSGQVHRLPEDSAEKASHDGIGRIGKIWLAAAASVVFILFIRLVFALVDIEYAAPAASSPAVAYDHGFRVEAFGFWVDTDVINLYLSIQDVTGQNRVTPSTNVHITSDEFQSVGMWGGSALHFNEYTNTLYLRTRIASLAFFPEGQEIHIPEDGYMHFDISNLHFSWDSFTVGIPLPPIPGEVRTKYIEEDYFVAWSSGLNFVTFTYDYDETFQQQTLETPGLVLYPSFGENFPALPYIDNVWISNMGFVDGRFHFQRANLIQEEDVVGYSSRSQGGVSLRRTSTHNGGMLWGPVYPNDWPALEYIKVFHMDKNLTQFIYTSTSQYSQINTPFVLFNERVYNMTPEELQEYSMYLVVSTQTQARGSWPITANINNVNKIDTTGILDDLYIEHFILLPAGLVLYGRGNRPLAAFTRMFRELEIYIETANGKIPLTIRDGDFNSGSHSFWGFNAFLTPDQRVDDLVKSYSIIINGQRIPIN